MLTTTHTTQQNYKSYTYLAKLYALFYIIQVRITYIIAALNKLCCHTSQSKLLF